jgi:hypothetical protein
LLIIYTVDEHGKKEKESRVWMDGTFQGSDHLAELLACRLYHLGISQAESVTFLADGAPWIWDRFDWLVETLKLPKTKVHYVLDFYHAAHHISLALSELSLPDAERRILFKELRRELKNSRWQIVIGRLKEMGADFVSDEESVFCRELRFLTKHGESHHLNYSTYTRRGLPLGSGAVESAIRRVINLRLKGNGMFWTEKNAESMLQLRCQILSTEWDVVRDELYHHRLKTRRRKWQWQADDHNRKTQNEAKPVGKNYENPEIQEPKQYTIWDRSLIQSASSVHKSFFHFSLRRLGNFRSVSTFPRFFGKTFGADTPAKSNKLHNSVRGFGII